eukprot:scaffold163320_cov18-Tisochrysis_lutea.AAC.1
MQGQGKRILILWCMVSLLFDPSCKSLIVMKPVAITHLNQMTLLRSVGSKTAPGEAGLSDMALMNPPAKSWQKHTEESGDDL